MNVAPGQQTHPYGWWSTYGQHEPDVAKWLREEDSPSRRLALGHIPEPDAPGYCTCGYLCSEVPTAGARPGYWQRVEW